MAKLFDIEEAATRLAELIDRALSGEEIGITKDGRPVVRLIPIPSAKSDREPGRWRGQMTIAPDFDAPLPESILRAFEGDEDNEDGKD